MAKFVSHIDLRQHQLKQAVIENLTAAPDSPKEGQVYFDTTEHKFKIYENGTWVAFANESHVSDTNNPHNVTAEQVGLGNVDNTSDMDKPVSTATQTALDLKADKSDTYTKAEVDSAVNGVLPSQADNAGKVLTTNGTTASWDYTVEVKNITESTSEGLSKLVINKLTKAEYDALKESGDLNENELYITDMEAYSKEEVDDKINSIDALPSQAGNEGKFLTTDGAVASWGTLPSATDSTEGVVKLATTEEVEAGESTTSVVTVSQMKSKLDTKADKSTTLAGYGITDAYTKAEVDDALSLKANSSTTLEGYGITDAYTKAEVDAKVSSVYRFKGSVANFDALPTEDQVVGDVWNVEDTGANYAWTGSSWDKLSETIDLTPYLTKEDASATYLTQATASDTYLTKSDASTTYLTQENATATYLTQTDAADTYATKDELAVIQSGSVHKTTATNESLSPVEGVATWNVAHTFGEDVSVSLKEVATGETVYADVSCANNSVTIQILSDTTIGAGTYKVTILG